MSILLSLAFALLFIINLVEGHLICALLTVAWYVIFLIDLCKRGD